MTVEQAGEGAGGRRRRWSGPGRVRWVIGGGGAGELGCGGSSAAVEQGRVWWVVGSGGAGEGAGGRRRRPVERGRGCVGCSAARGTGSGEVG